MYIGFKKDIINRLKNERYLEQFVLLRKEEAAEIAKLLELGEMWRDAYRASLAPDQQADEHMQAMEESMKRRIE